MRRLFILSACLGLAVPVQGEVLTIISGRAAPVRDVAKLTALAVERFGGPQGARLASAIDQGLADARDGQGNAYYGLYALSSPGSAGRIEAVVGGNASIRVSEERFKQTRRYCKASTDYRTDCKDKDKEEREVNCRRRTVTLESDIRVASEADGRILHRQSAPQQEQISWCPAQDSPAAVDETIPRLLQSAARVYVNDLTPFWQQSGVRLLEGRQGLNKEQGNRFKAALAATKNSGEEACRLFSVLAGEVPSQRSLRFNTALCSEMQGDYGRAAASFRAMGKDAEASQAANRVEGTLDAIAFEKQRPRARR